MLRVRYQTKADHSKIKAISLCNNSRLVSGETIVLENTKANTLLGYATYREYESKINIEQINTKPGNKNVNHYRLLFNHIKHSNPKVSIYLYKGNYAKELGFKGGEYKVELTKASLVTNEKLETRKEKLDGIDYLVAPVIMVKEQVLNGEFLPAEEIEKSVVGWNGRPVVVYHPKDESGRDTIANDPDVIPKYEVGRVYNAEYDPKTTKLKGEVWIDISRAKRKNDDTKLALHMIENSEHLEVSTGYIVNDRVEEEGTYDGIEFNAVQRDILPDHLALLPEEIGACSWDDGAGVRNNTSKFKGFIKRLVNNLTSKGSINSQLTNILKEEYDDFAWIQDMIHDDETGLDFVVFQTYEKANEDRITEQSKTFTIDYSFDDNGKVVLGDSLIEVEPIQQYIEKGKSEEETTLNKKELLVRDVIANSKNKLGRKDKPTLMACNTASLVSMLPKEKRKPYLTGNTSTAKTKFIANAFKSRKFKTNEGEEMLVEELIAMDPTDVAATVDTITDVAELEAVAATLEEVIQVAELVESAGSELEANEEFIATVEEVIVSAEEVLEVVEAAIDEMGGATEETDPAVNIDMTDITDPEDDLEEQLVSALETASSKRRRLRKNARNKDAKATKKASMSINDYIASIPDPEAREFIKNGVAESKKYRANLLNTLVGHKNCTFNEKELKAMETNQLEKIANMINSVGKRAQANNTSIDYSIRGMQTNNANNDKGYVPMTKNIFKGGK